MIEWSANLIPEIFTQQVICIKLNEFSRIVTKLSDTMFIAVAALVEANTNHHNKKNV